MSAPTRRRVWIQRIAVASVWVGAIVAWQVYQQANGLGTLDSAQRFIDTVQAHWWGPPAFVAAYLLRPLLLFPASLMTVAAGLVFGPVGGVLVVVVAANASAMLAYGIGRTLRGAAGDDADGGDGFVARWGRRMRARSFETVFLMRLLFVPYDLVNYVSGALRIRWTSFLLATVLGTLPGTVSFVLLGASLERLDDGFDGVNLWTFVAGLAIFAVSLLIARLVRGRADDPMPASTTPGTATPTTTEGATSWPTTTRAAPTAPSSSVPDRAA